MTVMEKTFPGYNGQTAPRCNCGRFISENQIHITCENCGPLLNHNGALIKREPRFPTRA